MNGASWPELPELPVLQTSVPGPISRECAAELRLYESPHITYIDERFPIFWESASGCSVKDADGNVFLDLTSAFGVAALGHGHPAVVEAVREQAGKLIHSMGDVHPTAVKVRLAKKLSQLCPGDLEQVIFGSSGSDAVEAALKTALMFTGKPGVLAFWGAYHGLSYGALSVTSRSDFRSPFLGQIGRFASHLPYPDCDHCPIGKGYPDCALACLNLVEAAISSPAPQLSGIGAVIVEPIQGRGGIIIPPQGWFRGLREICSRAGVLLIADEIFTGCGRTGSWFASEAPPDILCVGKILGGGLPLSACIASREVMAAWGASAGEAIHTSTFLGNPLACAAAIAVLDTLEKEQLVERCRDSGAVLLRLLEELRHRWLEVGAVRGRGLMIGVELVTSGGDPDTALAVEVMHQCLQRGVIVLPAGQASNVLELIPPFIISDAQMQFGVNVLEEALAAAGATPRLDSSSDGER